MACLLLKVLGGNGTSTEVGCYLSLIEKHPYLLYLRLVASSTCKFVGGCIVAAYNLVL